MRTYLTITIIFLSFTFCNAQSPENKKQTALSLELGKTGLLYNLSIDHRFVNTGYGLRLVAGSNFGKYLNALTVGGGGYYLIGGTTKFFELGLDLQYLAVDEVSDDQKGFSLVYPDYSIKTLYPNINLGYRRYGSKTLFRIGASPGVINKELVPGGYVSYGVLF